MHSPFPANVAFAYAQESELAQITLHAEEYACISPQAIAKRRNEFFLGRHAARKALIALGIVAPPPIIRGEQREPLWPAGLIGSISHSETIAVAAVTAADNYAGIGLDLEHKRSLLAPQVIKKFSSTAEQEWIFEDEAEQATRGLLVFSAKEAIYKALFPRYQKFFGYAAAEVLPEQEGRFKAELKLDIDTEYRTGTRFSVGWRVNQDWVLTWTLLLR